MLLMIRGAAGRRPALPGRDGSHGRTLRRQHPLESDTRSYGDLLGNLDLLLIIPQRVEGVLKGNFVHVRAADAAQSKDVLIWILGDDVVGRQHHRRESR